LAYLLLFAMAFGNQLALLLPVVPLLIAAGVLASRGGLNVVPAVLALTAGIATADFAWFQLGRRGGSRILGRVCRVSQEPDTCVRRVERLFARYGPRALVFAKFIPGLSTLALPVSGMLGMKPRRFVVYDALGDLLWSAAYVIAGYVSAKSVTAFPPANIRPDARLAAVALVVSIGAYIRWKVRRRRTVSNRLRAIPRISSVELHAKLGGREDPFVVDLRHPIELEQNPSTLPSARRIPAEELAARSSELPRDREIALYCSCPGEATSATEAARLQAAGFTRVQALHGGFAEWRARGFPIETNGLSTSNRS
jgi:membrane protein DedA with SNARE-associated domain/rhodanese-related sulfurtransferase